mmetsp:Transcript_60958/g.119524  ORF Transcript_60958/g.119524 Transcript_60958/m.119524 type:complete len:101 (+) Transcript_60958:105-407(+)
MSGKNKAKSMSTRATAAGEASDEDLLEGQQISVDAGIALINAAAAEAVGIGDAGSSSSSSGVPPRTPAKDGSTLRRKVWRQEPSACAWVILSQAIARRRC